MPETPSVTDYPLAQTAHDWTDEDGEPLGFWVPINCQDRERLMAEHRDNLSVFVSGTEVDVRVYTAWGLRGSNLPLWDDLLEGKPGEPDCVCTHRRFIATAQNPPSPATSGADDA